MGVAGSALGGVPYLDSVDLVGAVRVGPTQHVAAGVRQVGMATVGFTSRLLYKRKREKTHEQLVVNDSVIYMYI